MNEEERKVFIETLNGFKEQREKAMKLIGDMIRRIREWDEVIKNIEKELKDG